MTAPAVPPPIPAPPTARWIPPRPLDAAAVAALAGELKLPDAVCRLLLLRGYADADDAKRFLRPRLEHLHDPSLMLGMDRAVDRLVRAVRRGETIFIHGDYDVDGICSTTLLTRALRGMGGNVVPFIPRRLVDGYDLTDAGVRAAIDAGAGVVVTCDCGTSAREPIARLCAAGVDVIVTDHHLPGGPLPECLAVLNPRQPACEYPDCDLAAVGVAFKLAIGLARALGASENPILRMLDLVALATVADIAPLRGENRTLVRYGLRMMHQSDSVGLRALIRASGLEGKPLTAGRIGFILGPRLNAVGRLAHALQGVELLLTEQEADALRIARDLEELNRRRQEMDREILAHAHELIQPLDLDETFGLVLAHRSWHPGVVGIVASRVVEHYCRPTVLIGLQEHEGKGSGRSIAPFDLHAGLGECRDLLIRYGGHRAAAGVTIAPDRVAEFARRFNEVARQRLSRDDLSPELRVDLEIPLGEASATLETLLRHFEPFGLGNPSPVLAVRNVRLAAPPRPVGRDGLRLRLRADDVELEAIAWGTASLPMPLETGASIDVAFRLERDEWRGESKLQARIAAIRS